MTKYAASWLTLGAISFCMAGCATPYHPPPPTQAAFLEVKELQQAADGFQYFEGGDDCSDPKAVWGNDNPYKNGTGQLSIVAGKRIAIRTFTNAMSASCSSVVSFVPQVTKHYRFRMELQKETCAMTVTRIENGVDTPLDVEAPTAMRETFGFNTPKCEPAH